MQSRGGISTYFVKLINEFRADPTLGVEVGHLPTFVRSSAVTEAKLAKQLPLGRLARTSAMRTLNSAGAYRGRRVADLQHETFYLRKRLRSRLPIATTVHDMTPELYPDSFPAGNPHANKGSHVLAADLILCVSNTTRIDLLERYPAIAGNVIVTPEGTGPPFTLETSLDGIRDVGPVGRPTFPYVMFVGSRDRYKSFEMVPRALAEVRRRGHDVGLLLIGGRPLSQAETALINAAGLADGRFVHLRPNDEGLADLYRNALLLAYPSEYEGFGLPVLDALACGCAVVVSDAPALIEVGGDAVTSHPRGDAGALAQRMVEVIDAPHGDVIARRIRGVARAQAFSWRRTAELTADAYRTILA